MPKSAIAGSCGNCMFSFIINCQTWRVWAIQLLTVLVSIRCCHLKKICIHLYVVVSYCGLNLHFLNGWWCWTSVYVLMGYVYILFSKISVHVFYPFSIWIAFCCWVVKVMNLFMFLKFRSWALTYHGTKWRRTRGRNERQGQSGWRNVKGVDKRFWEMAR